MREPRVAIITGSGRGIGRGIAIALAGAGWTTILNGRSDRASAEAALASVRAVGGEGAVIMGDVASEVDRTRLVSNALDRYGRIDMLVNNAGIAPRQRVDLLDVSEDSMREVLATNLVGAFFLTQRVSRVMLELIALGVIDRGAIVNIGSISAYTSSTRRAEYCISKAGMTMMTSLFADRLASERVNVYEIRPGLIQTDMTAGAKDKYDALIAEGITPIRRWGEPEDVGRAVAAIAEGYLPFSTGQIIDVDGGFHIRRL